MTKPKGKQSRSVKKPDNVINVINVVQGALTGLAAAYAVLRPHMQRKKTKTVRKKTPPPKA